MSRYCSSPPPPRRQTRRHRDVAQPLSRRRHHQARRRHRRGRPEEQTAELHRIVDQTNFPLRAKRFAAEIRLHRPDLIGLQEVARYYRGEAGVHDKIRTHRTVLYDWLKILQTELKAAGQHYRVAVQQTELDVETASSEGYDLRLKLGNAILVRKGSKVKITGPSGRSTTSCRSRSRTRRHAQARLRGGRRQGRPASSSGSSIRTPRPTATTTPPASSRSCWQAAKSKKRTTIMAGDFNSSPTRGNAYNTVIGAGFKDTGIKARRAASPRRSTTRPPS